MTGKASGYIPSVGVWTAEERAHSAALARRPDYIDETMAQAVTMADATVAALMATLEDQLAMSPVRRQYPEQEQRDRNARALLDALK